ncbi:hypothetical protein [Terrisporobacter mayombei]|uniref:Uncharacterized protein n=1 Tax=Terrisporobacter mayombei TaxID=1541 RepID=A0ABY9Q190_9FIRM|nr:hypothetical protein [Terrisporobacter mayombei]WMT81742.1 hypothetical protein TEMA_20900 [Terrisporobacter mayombei]
MKNKKTKKVLIIVFIIVCTFLAFKLKSKIQNKRNRCREFF